MCNLLILVRRIATVRFVSLMVVALTVAALGMGQVAAAGDLETRTWDRSEANRGYWLLLENEYVPPQLDQEVFDNLWRAWEEPARSEAERATAAERRRLTLQRYGMQEAPGREGGIPLQYADNGQGQWVANCFLCHGGKLSGEVIPGLPNTHIALETLFKEIFQAKRLIGRQVPAEEAGALIVPLGGSNGTTNAIIFGVMLGAYRDADLNFHPEYPAPKMIHHDHDAPPWWNVKKKTHLYADGFAPNGHRALMQFMLTPHNGPEHFHRTEDDYKVIYDWILGLEAPKYPYQIDQSLAAAGQEIFNNSCADCHGTYGPEGRYEQQIIPIDMVGTDRARLDSLTPALRAAYEVSWFGNYGEKEGVADPGGYVAPPLDGIWASAPYLHNGSVPTLYHLFYPEERPVVWQRTEDGYDAERIGLEVTAYDELPTSARSRVEKKRYFDTRLFGKSAAGHLFPDELNDDEKRAVLEYLKTL